MDTVWIDTMYPGIDPDEGWEKNLERVVNYDYLLKEYLDWQLKHLTTDNMDPVDWANVQAEIISMAAGQIDLTAYYTGAEVDNIAQLVLAAAEDYATAEISAKVGDIGSATVKAYADNQIAGLSLAATGSGGNAQLVLQSGGSTIAGSGASLAMSVSNNSNGYSTVSLTSGGITLATSGNITLGGAVMFTGDNISRLNNNSGYQTSNGVTTIIGDTVTTSYINALNVTAKTIKADASISSPTITSATIKSSDIYASTIYATSGNTSNYCYMQSDGFTVVTNGYTRARLYQGSDFVALRLGDSDFAYVEKYQSGGTDYMWIGGGTRGQGGVGIRFDLDNKTYKIFGTAE